MNNTLPPRLTSDRAQPKRPANNAEHELSWDEEEEEEEANNNNINNNNHEWIVDLLYIMQLFL